MSEKDNHTALRTSDLESNPSDAPYGKEEAAGPAPRVRITVTSYRQRKHDPDGVSCKAVLDGIVRAGLLEDDSTDQVEEVRFRSVKVKTQKEEKTIIELEEV